MVPRVMREDVFRAVADVTRRGILDRLAQGVLPVIDLVRDFAMTQPAISQHLRVLRAAGLVVQKREGRFAYYSLEARPLREIGDWLERYERLWSAKLDALAAHLDRGDHAGKTRGTRSQKRRRQRQRNK